MSRAFRFLVGARDRLYQSGVLQTHRLHHPVISVGNLTVGGTGKTPLVIYLAECLRDEGYRPVVLSRGYKRKMAGVTIVSTGSGPLVPWEHAGDEPYLIATRANVSVVVGADRYAAGTLAEEKGLGDLFILDDGFQHRRLFREVDLVTIDPQEWLAGEHLFPYGRWREPKEALGRADAAIVQESGQTILPELPVPTFAIQTIVDGIYKGSERKSVSNLKNHAVTAFAGIAKPDRFFNSLENLGITPTRKVRFRDHHNYTQRDIDALPGEVQITTEKDAVRLDRLAPDVLQLRISVNIPEFERLMELIRSRLL